MTIESIRRTLDERKSDLWLYAPGFDEDKDLTEKIIHMSFLLDEIDNMLAELQDYGMEGLIVSLENAANRY